MRRIVLWALFLMWIGTMIFMAMDLAHAQSFFKGSTLSSLYETPTLTTTSGITTTLSKDSNTVQRFSGASNQTVVLPDATLLSIGRYFLIANDSSGTLTIRNATPATLKTAKAGDSYSLRLVNNSTAAGTWSIETNFSVVSLTADVSGILPIANGGTNNSSAYNSGSVIFSNGTALTQSGALTWNNAAGILDATNVRVGSSVIFMDPTFNQITMSTAPLTSAWNFILPTNDGNANQFMMTDGSGNTSWQDVTASVISGILPLSKGGTNANITASNGGVAFSTASAISIGPVGTSGQHLASAGAGAPTWTTATFPSTATAPCSLVANTNNTVTCLAATTTNRLLRTNGSTLAFSQADLTTDVTGVLPLANGGTNADLTGSQGGLLYKTATAVSAGPAGTAGQLVQSNGTSGYQYLTNGATGTAAIISGTNTITFQEPAKFAEFMYTNALGYGSSATKIPYFNTATVSSGNGILTVTTNNSTDGLQITALRPALVTATFTVYPVQQGDQIAISLNGGVTTNPASLTAAQRRCYTQSIFFSGAPYQTTCSVSFLVTTNDVIRPHTSAFSVAGSPTTAAFSVTATALPPF